MKKLVLIFFVIISFTGCINSVNENWRLIKYSGEIQGTFFHIKFTATEDSLQIINGIDSIFRLVDKTASLYDSNSIISKVNRNEDVDLNEHFINLFEKSQKVSEGTSGFFDITVAPLVKSWGFFKKKGLDLSQKQIDSIKQYVGYKKVLLKDNTLIKEDSLISIDFNAIAQGYTVDLVSDFLSAKGIKNYLIEIGGEVRAAGLKNETNPWVVGIEKPAENENSIQVVQEKISLTNRSLATSGNYRKFIIKNGVKYSHTIDPHTGYPVHHSLLSVTVLANDCATADAYATAFMVMGMDKSLSFLQRNPELDAYFIFSEANGNLSVKYTKNFEALIVK